MSEHQSTRRELLKKAMYVPPAILTLVAMPSFASAGSAEKSAESAQQKGEENRRRSNNWWEDILQFFGIK